MGRTVLIVEDSPNLALTFEVALQFVPDLDVRHSSSGREALDVMSREDGICALITDLNMPRMDGIELISRVRSSTRHSGLPIIVVSGDPDPSAPDRAQRAGANVFLSKPCSLASLRARLLELIDPVPQAPVPPPKTTAGRKRIRRQAAGRRRPAST